MSTIPIKTVDEEILPTFNRRGRFNVFLEKVESSTEAREASKDLFNIGGDVFQGTVWT